MLMYLIIGLLVLIGATGLLWKFAIIGQTPRKIRTDTIPEMAYEDISFFSGRNQLKGWLIPSVNNKHQQNPLIILIHGWSSSKTKMLRYLAPLYKAGYAVLMFDVRSHGDSEDATAPTVITFREDLIAAVHYAKLRPDIDSKRIGILGHSFGGFGSILANRYELGVQALVTDSIPVRFRTIMEASLKKYKLPYIPLGYILSKIMFFRARISRRELAELDALQALKERKSPVLLIHSKQDDYVPSTELDYILHHYKINHLFVESKGHRSSESDPKFWEHVLPFFQQHVMMKSEKFIP